MIRLLTALACAGIMVGCTTVHLTVIVPPESRPDSLVALEPLHTWIQDSSAAWRLPLYEPGPVILVPELDPNPINDGVGHVMDTLTIDTTQILKWIEL